MIVGDWSNSPTPKSVLLFNSKKFKEVLVLQIHNVESHVFGASRRYLVYLKKVGGGFGVAKTQC
jgi:hypothetical protein